MDQFLRLLETLETHLDCIPADLGAERFGSAAQIKGLAPAFQAAEDEPTLAHAVGDMYMACRVRKSIMTILCQTANTSGIVHNRRPPAGGTEYEDNILIHEISNCFQSLLVGLESIEQLEKTKKRQPKSRSQSGTEGANDH